MRTNIQYLSFGDCLNSLSTISCGFRHVTNDKIVIHFFFVVKIVIHFYGRIIFHCIYYHISCIYSSIADHLGWFLSVSAVNILVINVRVRVSLTYWMLFFVRMFSNGLAGSCVCIFSVFRISMQFSIVSALVYVPTSGGSVFSFVFILASIWDFALLIMPYLTGVRWYLTVFNLRFFEIGDIEHFFICLLSIYMPSFEKCLFIGCAHPLIGLFGFFWSWDVLVLYVFWTVIPSDE